MSLLSSLSAEQVVPEPFPHIVVEDALPAALADELADTFPAVRSFTHWKPYGSNQKFLRHGPGIMADAGVCAAWRSFCRGLEESLLPDCLRLFGRYLLAEYPDFEARFGRLEALRRVDGDPKGPGVFLDSMLLLHTPVIDRPRVERGPHVKITRHPILGYLNLRLPGDASTGADHELFRARPGARLEFDERQATNRNDLDLCKVIPRKHNSFIAFLNSPRSIQGLSARSVTPHPLIAHHFSLGLGEPLFELPLASGARRLEPGEPGVWPSLLRTGRVLHENANRWVRSRLRMSA